MRVDQRGFSMVEVMVSVLLLAGLGVGLMTIGQNQMKAEKGMDDKSELARSMGRIGEKISDPNNCRVNFLGKNIEQPLRLDTLKDRNNVTIVRNGEAFERGNYRASNIVVKNYDSDKNRVKLSIDFQRIGESISTKRVTKSFHFYAVVVNHVITQCLDPIEQTAFGSMMKSCYDVDPAMHGVCAENFTNLLAEVKRLYCTGHPLLRYDAASEKCLAVDGGKTCPGGYIQAFDGSGNFVCYSGPVSPPDPPDRVPLACASWSAWLPSAATVCSGTPLTQSRTCASSGATENQVIYGTKTTGICAPPCASPWSSWAPGAATVCSGLSLAQSRSRVCPSGPQNETQTAVGTKSDPTCSPCSGTWAPDPSTVCLGNTFSQSRICPDGSTQTQTLTGTNSSGSCCRSWGAWAPDSDSVCCEASVTQTRSCLDAGSTATDSRSVSGTKISGTCGGTWSPSLSATCSEQVVTQTNSCGINRDMNGTKTCGCPFLTPYGWSGGTGMTTYQCSQYFNPPPGLGNASIVIPEGDTYVINAGYCTDGSGGPCWGHAEVSCRSGTLVFGPSNCEAGTEP